MPLVGGGMRLTRTAVVEAARDIINESGLDALTTRQLGERLGVKGPAIYRHFKSKQEIIDAIAVTFFRDPQEPQRGCKWEDWLEVVARRTRQEILSCRDGAKIIEQAKPVLGISIDTYIRPLCEAGFSRKEALFASHLVGRFVMGWTKAEQEHQGRTPPYDEGLDSEEAFEYCLKSLLAGLQMRLVAARMQAKPGPGQPGISCSARAQSPNTEPDSRQQVPPVPEQTGPSGSEAHQERSRQDPAVDPSATPSLRRGTPEPPAHR